jgi:cyanuric acid amidohydrolase
MRTPSDVSELARLFEEGVVEAQDVIAVVGKSEGTGLGKDTGRETADRAIKEVIARHLGVPVEEVTDRLCMILSGGSPGVITPHVAVFSRREDGSQPPVQEASSAPQPRLVAGLAHSAEIAPEEVGRMGQITKVSTAVANAVADAGLENPADVHLVLVKAPSLTAEGIFGAQARGLDTVTHDLSIGPEGAICYSNDASALGVALALGEVAEEDVHDDMVRRDFSVYSDVSITSSGGEKTHAEVLVLGNAAGATSALRIGHRSMTSIIDATAVEGALRSAGIEVVCGDTRSASKDLVYALAKMILPATSELDGRRITLLDDQLGYHVAKAMGGFLLASATGRTEVFVSGGEFNSHQGPPNGNPLAVIVRAG